MMKNMLFGIFHIGEIYQIPTYIVVTDERQVPEISLDNNNDICGPPTYVCRIAGISPTWHGWDDTTCCDKDFYVEVNEYKPKYSTDKIWVFHKYTERYCCIHYFDNFQYVGQITSFMKNHIWNKRKKAMINSSQNEIKNRIDFILN